MKRSFTLLTSTEIRAQLLAYNDYEQTCADALAALEDAEKMLDELRNGVWSKLDELLPLRPSTAVHAPWCNLGGGKMECNCK